MKGINASNVTQIQKKPLFLKILQYPEAVTQRCSVKKVVLRNFAKFTGKHLC